MTGPAALLLCITLIACTAMYCITAWEIAKLKYGPRKRPCGTPEWPGPTGLG